MDRRGGWGGEEGRGGREKVGESRANRCKKHFYS